MSARSTELATAVETLVVKDGDYRMSLPLFEDMDPASIVQNVKSVLAMMGADGVTRAEARHRGVDVSREHPLYLEGERMLIGTLEHALAVAHALLEDKGEQP